MEPREAVVLVTGASAGIGRATALALDRAGARVAMAARRRERLEENAGRMRDALVVPTDMADERQVIAMVDETVKHFGRLDVLINNAGTSVMTRGDALDPASVRRLLEVNFIGAVIATNRAVPQMRRQGHGHVINVGSPAGFLGVPLFASYTASKAAMHGWTRSLQAEWAGTEIFVSEYHPGLIATEMHEASVAASNLGDVGGLEAFEDESQSAIVRRLNVPLPPEKVADDLVECVRRPRLVMYSNFAVRLGSALAQVAPIRLRITSGMAKAFRRKSNLAVFTDEPVSIATSLSAPVERAKPHS